MRVLVRFANEIYLKSAHVRTRFQRQLQHNIALALPTAQMHAAWNRILLQLPDAEGDDERRLEVLTRIAGIGSYSPIISSCAADLEQIVASGAAQFQAAVHGKSFAVRAKRIFKHAFTSKDIEIALGAKLVAAAAKVDLRQPDITVHVEVHRQEAVFFTDVVAGVSGLPIGTGGRGIALISGGFDSIVAAKLMYGRGVKLDYVFANLPGDRAHAASVLQIIKTLWQRYGIGDEDACIYHINYQPLLAAMRERIAPRYQQVILKRLLYRSAELLGAQHQAIVTGESIGQVSSQTLANLVAIEAAVAMPVLRPLIAHHKEQIIAITRAMGMYQQCANIQEYCQLTDAKPVTNMSADKVQNLDADILAMLPAQLEQAECLKLAEIKTDDVSRFRHVGDIPADAVLIDCRSDNEYQQSARPNFQHFPYQRLIANFQQFDKTKTYLIYCQSGLQSTAVAALMQDSGYHAYSVS
ncbi:MAG: THUMP domain-containing protein [Pseudomonadota bacterium]|nr:THUMP domain-containing protein [Pseudomonadota bacterium]